MKLHLLEFEKCNVKKWRVVVHKLEQIHLEWENVFQLGLCARHLWNYLRKKQKENKKNQDNINDAVQSIYITSGSQCLFLPNNCKWDILQFSIYHTSESVLFTHADWPAQRWLAKYYSPASNQKRNKTAFDSIILSV